MTADAILVLQTLFGSVWSLLTSWYIPGTNVTPAAMFFFILAAFFLLRVIRHYTGSGEGGGSDAS